MSKFRRSLGVALAAPVILVACGHSDRSSDSAAGGVAVGDVKFAARDSSRILGPGDVQIASTDSAVEVGIFGDTIVGGLGRKVLDRVQSETDTTAVKGNGLGASIEKLVKKNVADALSHQLLFPISQISDVRYEDGSLQFYGNNGSKMHVLENSNGKNNHSTFTEADAARFIAAFKARKAGPI